VASTPPAAAWYGLAAGVAVALVFITACGFEFVNYDDGEYVTNNEHVKMGLSAAGLRWAFTTYEASNWHPLTWLSLQADVSLFGVNAHRMHLTSVLLHAGAVAFLARALQQLTGARWRSLVAAIIFGVHPLRVESVAWISERKDVLAMFFGMATLWAYARWAREGRRAFYALALVLFALGLLAKPSLVTVPAALLLVDLWPAARARLVGGRLTLARLVVEKLPFLTLGVAASVLTVRAQYESGAMGSGEFVDGTGRVLNAAVAYVTYLRDTFWPGTLAPLYPHPGRWPLWRVAVSIAVIGAITTLSFLRRRQQPYLLFGWLWFIGTAVPMIGLVQVGWQSHADRYTYLPGVGLTVALVWLAADLLQRSTGQAAALAAVCIGALGVRTSQQLPHWEETKALSKQLTLVVEGPLEAAVRDAEEHEAAGRWEEAFVAWGRASRAAPELADVKRDGSLARDRWGEMWLDRDRAPLALAQFEAALVFERRNVRYILDWAEALRRTDQEKEALRTALAVADAERHMDGTALAARIAATAGDSEVRDPLLARRLLAEAGSRQPVRKDFAYHSLALALAALGDETGARNMASAALEAAKSGDPRHLAWMRADLGALAGP
jgi:hypothetical protein